MQIEIEKKYNLSKEDYEIIKNKCEFLNEVNLKDYYLDKDFILSKNKYYLRLRNGKYELKICSFNPDTKLVTAEEFEKEEDINKQLKRFNFDIDDTTGILFIDTKREKYQYNYKGYNLNIDVEEFQYGTRYEIEIVYRENKDSEDRSKIEAKLNKLIEDFRKKLGLTALNDVSTSKVITCAMHQNLKMYEIMSGQYV